MEDEATEKIKNQLSDKNFLQFMKKPERHSKSLLIEQATASQLLLDCTNKGGGRSRGAEPFIFPRQETFSTVHLYWAGSSHSRKKGVLILSCRRPSRSNPIS
ncbi:MAG: hypothetical protein KH615_04675 [Clostridiales bacterium]|nr:hypothetical protein [Clostridiales bacterium]